MKVTWIIKDKIVNICIATTLTLLSLALINYHQNKINQTFTQDNLPITNTQPSDKAITTKKTSTTKNNNTNKKTTKITNSSSKKTKKNSKKNSTKKNKKTK